MEYTLSGVKQIWVNSGFGTTREGFAATLTFDTGDVVGVSKMQGEEVWCADSRIGPNGMPYFVHGEGDRSCNKQVISVQDIADALDEATQTMMEEMGSGVDCSPIFVYGPPQSV